MGLIWRRCRGAGGLVPLPPGTFVVARACCISQFSVTISHIATHSGAARFVAQFRLLQKRGAGMRFISRRFQMAYLDLGQSGCFELARFSYNPPAD